MLQLPSFARVRRLGIVAWLVLAVAGWHEQAAAQQFSFRQYAQSDGLTNLAVGYLVADPDGDLWAGSDGGVFRFDGTAFVPYDAAQGLPSETVRGLAVDPFARLWVSLDRGLFVGGAAGFNPVRTESGPVLTDHTMPIAFMGQDHVLTTFKAHVLELQRAHGAALWQSRPLFAAEQLKATPGLDKVVSLYTDPNGTLWLGCSKKICSLSHGQVRAWDVADGVPEGAYGAFLADRTGHLWARSDSHLLVRAPGASEFAVNDPPHARLESRVVDPMLTVDAGGRLFTRTAPGVARWDGTHWEEFTTDNGLADSVVAKTQVDQEGSLWLSPLGLGIWRWRGYDNVESWTRAQGFISQKVWNIDRDHDNRLLVGTERGCQMLDEKARRLAACPFEALPQVEVIALSIDPKGGVWWGLENSELWVVPPHEKRAHLVKFPEAQAAVSVIYFDRNGGGWIVGYTDGLYRLDPTTERLEKVALPHPETRVYDITQDTSGTLWVAGSGGFFRLSGADWVFVPVAGADGSLEVYNSVVAAPDGSIWASNFGKGLLHASGPNLEYREWVKPEVLANAGVYSVRVDQRGRLWASTDQGAVIYDGQNWLRFDAEDGLAGNDTEAFAFLSDSDGSTWIGTAAGMTHIHDPERLLHPQGPLDLRIATAHLGDKVLDPQHKTTVPWQADAALDVRFSSHNYSRSPQTEFRYRLLGLSSQWFGSLSPELHLPALAGGRYELQIMAVDAPHARKSALVTLSFEVLPPWWRTLTFKSCVALLLVGLVALGWRLQVEKLRARRIALEREFRERERLLERATRDALTGLWNRATIMDVLSRELTHAQRADSPLALALIDVDHFKHVNDTYGHHGGDEVLRELARRLGANIRQNDWLGRYGGEELMIILPGLPYVGAATPIERLRECVSEKPFRVGDVGVTLTVSIGMAWCESPSDTAHEVISRADSALYQAKRSGRNRVVYPPSPAGSSVDNTGSRRYMVELRDRLKREVRKA
jgi:diguanylate cyclase (GGDEF)-like protein